MAYFWSMFKILGAKKGFTESSALSRTTSYGFLGPCENLEKNYRYNSKKMPRQKDGRTCTTCFIGLFRLLLGVKISKCEFIRRGIWDPVSFLFKVYRLSHIYHLIINRELASEEILITTWLWVKKSLERAIYFYLSIYLKLSLPSIYT